MNNKSTDITNNNESNENDMDNFLASEETYNNVIDELNNNNKMIIEEEIDEKNDKYSLIVKKTDEIKKILEQYFIKNNNQLKNSKTKNKKNKSKKKLIKKEITNESAPEKKQQEQPKNKSKKIPLPPRGGKGYTQKPIISKNFKKNKTSLNSKEKGNELNNTNSIINNKDKDTNNNIQENKPIEKKALIHQEIEHQHETKRAIFGIVQNRIEIPATINKENIIEQTNNNLITQNYNAIFPSMTIKQSKENSIQINPINPPQTKTNSLINFPTSISPLRNNNTNQINVVLDLRFNFGTRQKKNFFAEIEELSPNKLLGNKTNRTNSDLNIRIRRKRGRKKKKYLEKKLDSCDIEVSGAISESIRKNDIDRSINKYSIELEGLDKSSSMNMPLNKNIKSTEEISSQNTSKEQNKQSFSLANLNLINDNNLNNVHRRHYKNTFHQRHKRNDLRDNSYFIRINEDDDEINLNNLNNRNQDENLEIFSLTSTPEAKKRLRHNNNNLNHYNNVYTIGQAKRGRKRKQNVQRSEEYIDLEISQHKDRSNISKKSKESSEFYSDINLFKDDNYFSYDTQYLKYNPVQNLQFISNNNTINIFLEDIPSIYQIPRINPKIEDLFPKISETLKKIGMSLYDKEEREEELYKGSFPLIDDKKKIEVLVPCYDDNKIFVDKKKKFPKLQKFDEDNDILTDDEQLGMEIKRGNECLNKFLKEAKENKNYIAEKLSRNNIKKVREENKEKMNEEESVGDIEESIEESEEDEDEEEESDEDNDESQIVIE